MCSFFAVGIKLVAAAVSAVLAEGRGRSMMCQLIYGIFSAFGRKEGECSSSSNYTMKMLQ